MLESRQSWRRGHRAELITKPYPVVGFCGSRSDFEQPAASVAVRASRGKRQTLSLISCNSDEWQSPGYRENLTILPMGGTPK
jgi:hypothetical protein